MITESDKKIILQYVKKSLFNGLVDETEVKIYG